MLIIQHIEHLHVLSTCIGTFVEQLLFTVVDSVNISRFRQILGHIGSHDRNQLIGLIHNTQTVQIHLKGKLEHLVVPFSVIQRFLIGMLKTPLNHPCSKDTE